MENIKLFRELIIIMFVVSILLLASLSSGVRNLENLLSFYNIETCLN